MSSRYNHKIAEKKWQKKWVEGKVFESKKVENKKKYYVSIQHAMRIINKVGGIENLNGVIDVGYKVEKIK